MAWILQRQGTQGMRQSKADMRVGRVEHFAFPRGEPRGLGGARAFRAAAVAAGVVRLDLVATMGALRDMAPESSGPAQGDSPQGPLLLAAQGMTIARKVRCTILAYYIGGFKGRRTHGRLPKSAGNAKASRGLSVACSAGWAT